MTRHQVKVSSYYEFTSYLRRFAPYERINKGNKVHYLKNDRVIGVWHYNTPVGDRFYIVT